MTTNSVSVHKNQGIKAGVVLLVIFLFLFALPNAVLGASEDAFGDVNEDGAVNVEDVVKVMRYVLELETLNADQRERADVSGNGVVDVRDVTLIMQRALELVEEFPVQDVPIDTFFVVVPGQNSIKGYNWLEDAEVTVSFDDVELNIDTDEDGSFELHQWEYEELEFEVGQAVVVTDGTTTKAHIVRELSITGVDGDEDVVSGRAYPGNTVEVRVHDMERDYRDLPLRTVVAGTAGRWRADFSEAEGTDPAEEAFDIVEGLSGEARINDLTGDATMAYWIYENAVFGVYLDDSVTGFGWSANAEITVTVEDDQFETESDSHGYFSIEVETALGDTVTVTDGIQTKEHVVANLEVTAIDRDNGLVEGTADPESTVYIELLRPLAGRPGPPELIDEAEVEAALDGSWSYDFDQVIEDDVDIYVMQEDDDGDRTVIVK